MGQQSNISPSFNASLTTENRFSINSVTGGIFSTIYVSTCLTSIIGNCVVLLVCYRGTRRRFLASTTPLFNLYVANLAVADTLFTLLTAFDAASLFPGKWIFGDILCKIQGFLLESCYSASILTLVAISRERLKLASEIQMKSRVCRANERKKRTIILWISTFLLCSPLLLFYTILQNNDEKNICTNLALKDLGRQVYYSLAAVVMFFVPLSFMIWTHLRITRAFKVQVMPNKKILESIRIRQKKVTKMLRVVTLVFVCLWAPFIIVRQLKYFHLYNGYAFWMLSQLLILMSAASNPCIYIFYSSPFRAYIKSLVNCSFARETARDSIVMTKVTPKRFSLHSVNISH